MLDPKPAPILCQPAHRSPPELSSSHRQPPPRAGRLSRLTNVFAPYLFRRLTRRRLPARDMSAAPRQACCARRAAFPPAPKHRRTKEKIPLFLHPPLAAIPISLLRLANFQHSEWGARP